MTQKQEMAITALKQHLVDNSLEIIEHREINNAQQFRVSDGSDICPVTVYNTGKIVIGGKSNIVLRNRLEEWKNLYQAGVSSAVNPPKSSDNRSTNYTVASQKYDKIRNSLTQLSAQITWYEGEPDTGIVYRAELLSDGSKVVITQYHTHKLRVQGRASPLFDEVCLHLDNLLTQSAADKATRFIPEEQSSITLAEMNRPEAETEAWDWLIQHLSKDILDFVDEHDKNTLVSGAMLLNAVKKINLPLLDYSTLIMPFARAYEGFLVKVFIHIGLANPAEIERKVKSIQIGRWLETLSGLIEDPIRNGHLVVDLQTAWEGTRHLTIHSDPVRQASIPNFQEAEHEICGVLLQRAFRRGFEMLVSNQIKLKPPTDIKAKSKKTPPSHKKQSNVREIQIEDEAGLLQRLEAAGHSIQRFDDLETVNKWQVKTNDWKVNCPRNPGNTIKITGKGHNDFIAWLNQDIPSAKDDLFSVNNFINHIGVDEAGKGDYFGPLVSAAVYLDEATALNLIRWGVKDSKSMSDNTIRNLALRIREACPHHTVKLLMPPEYNQVYAQHQNLNIVLAELHAAVIVDLVKKSGCQTVLVDQFADPSVLQNAVDRLSKQIDLSQRPKAEEDIAVAAASILAREAFVAAIEDYRVKSELEIPLGSSAPEVVKVGKAIVRKWGQQGLARIAKINFKTTRNILS